MIKYFFTLRTHYRLLLLLLLYLPAQIVNSAGKSLPDWTNSELRGSIFKESEYLTGFGSSALGDTQDDRIQNATDNARKVLSRRIVVNLESSTRTHIAEVNGQIEELTEIQIKSNSDLSLVGVEVKTHYDSKKKRAYAIAIMNRRNAHDYSIKRVKNLRKEIDEQLELGDRLLDQGKRMEAMAAFQRCYNRFPQIEEALLIAEVTGGAGAEIIGTTKSNVTRSNIDSRVSRIWDAPVTSISDAADILAKRLETQFPEPKNVSCLMGPFYYEGTKFSSDFSERMRVYLRAKLRIDWRETVGNYNPKSNDKRRDQARQCGADWVLEARLLPSPDAIKILIMAYPAIKAGTPITAEVDVPKDVIKKEGLNAEPVRYADLLSVSLGLAENELIPEGKGLELWTDQGSEGVVVHKGEKIRFYVRTSNSGYLRLIYRLSNGERTPLYTNYFISEAQANKVITLPDEFECCPPYGNEIVLALFSSEQFPHLNLKSKIIDGEEYEILVETLTEITTKTRGLKKAKKNIEVFDTRISITTMD
ncbi:MAG: DUF4384 domain-containing protein [Candidatus Hatepunaea meridiana]|nr:DUF4384 domain-containing protein [Candidatus Hatepunaea meridiana]